MESFIIDTAFATDVLSGLKNKPKRISSKYFYDEKGSEIFKKIMRMPEYYPTNCEYDIFKNQAEEIRQVFCNNHCMFDLIELGAGDGMKTKVLIDHFLKKNVNFQYIPIDISAGAVENLAGNLKAVFPKLNIRPLIGDYFEMMHLLNGYDSLPKVLLFLGSNIGNFNWEESILFLKQLGAVMNKNDRLLIGFDLKKDPDVILKAYNDPHGHTRDFNLNLLTRMNTELGADFNLDAFRHYPLYEPSSGEARSYLMSLKEQTVRFKELEVDVHFKKWETIHTEISRKYDKESINAMAKESGFEVVRNFTDDRQYFMNSYWKLKASSK